MNETIKILIADDEKSILLSLKSYLKKKGYEVFTAEDGDAALEFIKSNRIDFLLTDFRMPGKNGFELLADVKKFNPNIDVVVITAFGTIEDAVKFMKEGAYDYLTKPIDLDELDLLLARMAERKLLLDENRELKKKLETHARFDGIIASGAKMDEVLNTASRVADSRATILIRGESGTGKEMVAKTIHLAGDPGKPFVTVNAAALPDNLLESELFGFEKGAFTGAVERRKGRFEEASGGTLFIDEVGDIPMNVQVKLLRAVQFGEIQRLGSNETITVDVRFIAATHRNLEEMIKSGEFREDLYYRLNVVPIFLPPLRERKEDIPALTEHFIKKHAERNGKLVSGVDSRALDKLSRYNFPGNVRELENIIERAVVLSRGEFLSERDIPDLTISKEKSDVFNPANLDASYDVKMKEFEKRMINSALELEKGNKSAAARRLGISERHLRSRLERL
ncbi:MAG: acetoacetate metabolism regulatory protein AtoC [Melioribacteraceae bacterium]|nr:MAG: acetoacetate metabolism regulatory protein AtoC [Melioribacteraceae bacterium]